jgi:hypothetical protein
MRLVASVQVTLDGVMGGPGRMGAETVDIGPDLRDTSTQWLVSTLGGFLSTGGSAAAHRQPRPDRGRNLGVAEAAADEAILILWAGDGNARGVDS